MGASNLLLFPPDGFPEGGHVNVDDITHDASFPRPTVPRRLPGVSLCGTENCHWAASSGDRDWPPALLDFIEISQTLGFKLGCAHYSLHDVSRITRDMVI